MTGDQTKPIVYLITKGEATDINFATTSPTILDIIGAAVALEIPLIQIREKKLSARWLFQLTKQAVGLTRGTQTRILVNDRADVALAAGADGVHLTTTSLSTEVIREHFSTGFLIAVSTHAEDEVILAEKLGADFAVFGPVFASPGKGVATGADELARVCSAVPSFPILGLGGVDETNCQSVIAAGAAGFASIRWLNDLVALSST